jgi:hypothetical protein
MTGGDGMSRAGVLPEPYAATARLLLPPGGAAVATVAWNLDELDEALADDVLWGEPPRRRPPSLADVGRHLSRRETALLRLRAAGSAGRRVVGVHRLSPWAPPGGWLRSLARDAVRGGVLVELARLPRRPRPLDRAVVAADAVPAGGLLLGTGGSILQPVQRGEEPALLRAGLPNSGGDPHRAADGLVRVASITAVPAPALLARGASSDIAWAVEERLPGRPPRRLTGDVLGATVRALSAMPVTDADPTGAARRDLARLADLLPARATELHALGSGLTPLADSGPAVVGHGDVWTGNLLCEGQRLTGLVDWDAWAEDTAPGTDLLQLVATAWRQRAGLTLGAAWRHRPWHHPRFSAAAATYWRGIGLQPSPEHLDALGIAWWAREAAGTLTRSAGLRTDGEWLVANIDAVTQQAHGG